MKGKRKKIANPYGDEPEWGNSTPTQSEIGRALTWYHYNWEPTRLPAKLRAHCKSLGVDATRLPFQICIMIQMQMRGCLFEPKHEAIIRNGIEVAKKVQAVKAVPTRKVSVQEQTREKSRMLISDLDAEFDAFIQNGWKSEFDAYKWLEANGVTAIACKHIMEAYEPVVVEFMQAATGQDEQLVEGYSHWPKSAFLATLKFLQSIMDNAKQWASNRRVRRKPRKKRAPNVEKMISKLQYQKESSEHKIVSIRPETIIGAKQLWIYNTRYNTLSVLDAADESGLSIKGTTIQNIADSSITKKVPKTKETLPAVVSGGKRVLRSVMGNINRKESKAKGRINSNTVLLRVIT